MQQDPRIRIISSAGPIFAEKGFEAATVRQICQAADVNVASINYYFGDKESLYIETVRRARQMRAAEVPMPELDPETPPGERLYQFTRTLLTRMAGAPESNWQSRLMLREVLQPTEACRQMVEEYFRPDFRRLLEILDDLLPADTPQHVRQQVGFSLVGQCLFYRVARGVLAMLLGPDEWDEAYSLDRLSEHITRLMLAALGHGPPIGSLPNTARLQGVV
jgi:TetR/AcrR family transcriptional regulator, regulator of cefoperazone and chloramphenicol sensitivity